MRFINRKTGWLLLGLALISSAFFLVTRSELLPWNLVKGSLRTTHTPQVLYLSPVDAPELWRVGVDGKNPVKLTTTGGEIYDYAVSPDGSRIAYSVGNAQNGRDLWEVNWEGGGRRELLPCGTDWCQTPAYAPDGLRIAYSRRQYNGLGGEPGVPRLWMLDLSALSTEIITADASMSGSDPAWSPDGRHLAFADMLSGGVRVLGLQEKNNFLVPAEANIPAAWSPDGQKLLVIHMEGALVEGESVPGLAVSVVNVSTRQVSPLPGASDGSVEYNLPDWSPDGQWLAAAQRPFAGSGGKQLSVFRADGSQRRTITDDPLVNDAAYHWSPDGAHLVFQRLDLSQPGSRPKIMLWDRASGKVSELAQESYQPQWLP